MFQEHMQHGEENDKGDDADHRSHHQRRAAAPPSTVRRFVVDPGGDTNGENYRGKFSHTALSILLHFDSENKCERTDLSHKLHGEFGSHGSERGVVGLGGRVGHEMKLLDSFEREDVHMGMGHPNAFHLKPPLSSASKQP